MDYINRLILLPVFVFTFLVLNSGETTAQSSSNSYSFTPAPDLWFNAVDGVRVGARLRGEMEGSFNDGPHRLDVGLWLGTSFPEDPVSYYLSFTEPIAGISGFGEEGNIRLQSSVRTGLARHRLSLNKRWQNGFDERRYRELTIFASRERMFDADYRPYEQLWQTEWKTLVGINLNLTGFTPPGKAGMTVELMQNVDAASGNFSVFSAELTQQIELGKDFILNLRSFTGLNSSDAAPEYLYGLSYRRPDGWLNNGVSRAKGTLPEPWLNDGVFQVSGSANLRGYAVHEYGQLADGRDTGSSRDFVRYDFGYHSVTAFNAELEFPNPVNRTWEEGLLGGFIQLKSYLFADAGYFSAQGYREDDIYIDETVQESYADAGIGLQFSFNIPDYLGKDRGFAVRYELPLWLSKPQGDENPFEFRQLIGVGAVISL